MSEQKSIFSYLKYGLYAIVGIYFISSFFRGSDDSAQGADYIEQTLEDPTQGIIAQIKEVDADLFKITDEEIIDKREDSRIIATFLDNTVDTFTLDEIRLEETGNPRRSMMRSIAYAGMFGYMMGRPMSSGISRSAYADDKTFNKSNTKGTSQLKSTASRRTVRTPAKKGFGSGKSTRSYGG